jgi:outer membrane protein TolC
VITRQFRAGQTSITDLLQQRQLIESRIGQRAQVQANMDVLSNTLAVLLGRAPGAGEFAATAPLPGLPPAPTTGIPAELIQRRPDLRAAEIRVRAADEDVGTAIADRFPRLQMGLNASTSAADAGDLFSNWLASLAGNLTAPLFDAGQRRAEVDRTRAVLAERLNIYRQTVLEALQEVEDALVREQRQAEYVASLERQLELSTQAMEQILNNYTKGTVEFTRYLTALLAHQSLQATHLEARLNLVLIRVGLYRALAGGWEMTRDKP